LHQVSHTYISSPLADRRKKYRSKIGRNNAGIAGIQKAKSNFENAFFNNFLNQKTYQVLEAFLLFVSLHLQAQVYVIHYVSRLIIGRLGFDTHVESDHTT